MKIEDLMHRISSISDITVLVAKPPFTWGAESMFTELTDDYRVPQDVIDSGFQYLLGKEDLVKILDISKTKKMSVRSVAELVVHYALTDSFPAWLDDIPAK